MKTALTVQQAKKRIADKLSHFFGVSPAEADNTQYYKAVAMILKDMLSEMNSDFRHTARGQNSKKVYYLCMEFLMGRSLKNNLYNLHLTEVFETALKSFDVSLDQLYDLEPDAGLGNGGLGRLAACYLDGLATEGYPSMGYSIRYDAGIFKQKLVDGWQTELPDFWLPGGDVWLVPREERSVEVKFEGHIEESWDGDFHRVEHKDYNSVIAVPYDMYVSGYGKGISRLRLWASRKPELDMRLFNQGQYMRAMESRPWPRRSPRCFTRPIISRRAKACACASSISWFPLPCRILSAGIWPNSARSTTCLKRSPSKSTTRTRPWPFRS